MTVNGTLTVDEPQDRTRPDGSKVVENSAYASMLARMIRAYGRRLAAGDVEDLANAQHLVDELHTIIRTAVDDGRQRDPEGWSWARIGRALRTTRQAAQQRFSR